MDWVAEQFAWVCPRCARVEEANDRGETQRVAIPGSRQAAHIRDFAKVGPREELPRRDPLAFDRWAQQVKDSLAEAARRADEQLLRGDGEGMEAPNATEFWAALKRQTDANRQRIEDAAVQQVFGTRDDQDWLHKGGVEWETETR